MPSTIPFSLYHVCGCLKCVSHEKQSDLILMVAQQKCDNIFPSFCVVSLQQPFYKRISNLT